VRHLVVEIALSLFDEVSDFEKKICFDDLKIASLKMNQAENKKKSDRNAKRSVDDVISTALRHTKRFTSGR